VEYALNGIYIALFLLPEIILSYMTVRKFIKSQAEQFLVSLKTDDAGIAWQSPSISKSLLMK
jgi:hypothetical protein